MVDIDSETLFNGTAAAITTIAVLVYLLNVEFPYSPVTKYALAIGFLGGVFALTQRASSYQLVLFGYAVILISAVAMYFEIISTFNLGNTATVLGLLIIAAAIFLLRDGLDENSQFLTGQQATIVFGVILAVVGVVLVVDVVSGGLAYELQTQQQVTFAGAPEHGGQDRVGTLVVRNPTPLPERVDTPTYAACTVGNWSAYRPQPNPEAPPEEVRVHLRVEDGYNEHIMSFGTKSYPVVLNAELLAGGDTAFPIERTDACPDAETGRPYIAIFETTGARPDYRAV